jgi:hypothetical protein
MIEIEQRSLIEKNPNYRITFFDESKLREELRTWCREDLIAWLKWNDPNGIYEDQESLDELGTIMTHQEGVDLIIKQAKG